MNTRKIRAWAWVPKWSSLVCTVFMLLLCITGLPLIFHHEIGHLLGTQVEAPDFARLWAWPLTAGAMPGPGWRWAFRSP